MKKLPGLLLLILVLAQGACKKSNDASIGETSAHILYGGDPAVDGKGYYIHLDGTGEDVIPINLPSVYRQTTVNTSVAIKLLDTGKRQAAGYSLAGSLGFRVVYIVAVREL